MSLSQIPPWLNITPELFLNAAKSGASLGLERRGQDIGQSEAGDRLRLAYASLASEEARAAQKEQAIQEMAAAKLRMAQEQANQLHQYRQNSLSQRQDQLDAINGYRENALGLRESRGEALDKYRGEMINARETALGQHEDQMAKLEDYRGKLTEARNAALELRQARNADSLTALQKHDLSMKSSALNQAKKAYSNAIANGDDGPISAAARLMRQAQGDYDTFRSSLSSPNVPQGQAPHADGTVLRKSDGSRWIVQDGAPVPYDETAPQPDDEESDTEE